MGSQRPRTAKPDPQDWGDDTWLHPLPLPEVEEGGESMLEAWHEADRDFDEAFGPTQPSQQAPLSVDTQDWRRAIPARGAAALSADALMLVARRNNRVCPQPRQWARLYQLLQGDHHPDLAPPPLERPLWAELSSLQKRVCLRGQIEWAERRGKLVEVAQFFQELDEGDWVHMG
ncbi:MAG: hypothetical protein JWQ76_4092 [Ramlibacter sp.]|nr:hypothetical protein [Ramlibacter sp.]